MKPLPQLPLTPEDIRAWGFIEGEAWDSLMIASRLSDRRDAQLMLGWLQWPRALVIPQAIWDECRVLSMAGTGEIAPPC